MSSLRKEAWPLYQKWKAALCYQFLWQPAHKIRRTSPVLCQGFCVYCAVNCICFKVWDVSQGENGQVANPNAYNNWKSRSLESSPAGQGPTLAVQLPPAHTVINRGFKDRPQLWSSCRKVSLLPAAAVTCTSWDRFASSVVEQAGTAMRRRHRPCHQGTIRHLRCLKRIQGVTWLLERSAMLSVQQLVCVILVHLLMAQTDTYN